MAVYRHQFKKRARHDGEDPSIFAINIETLTVKAFGDMVPSARLRLIQDRFIASNENCALRCHLDSVLPETPIRVIVDRCRVWESHADTDTRRILKPTLERARPVYTANESTCVPADQVVTAFTVHSVGLGDLKAFLRRLLPTAPVQTLPPRPVPTEMEIMLEHLLLNAPVRTAITEMETLLQCLLPGATTRALWPRPVLARMDWTTIVCFSFGQLGHGVSRCPKLDETFPYMLPGCSAEKVDANYMMILPRVAAERLRAGNGD